MKKDIDFYGAAFFQPTEKSFSSRSLKGLSLPVNAQDSLLSMAVEDSSRCHFISEPACRVLGQGTAPTSSCSGVRVKAQQDRSTFEQALIDLGYRGVFGW